MYYKYSVIFVQPLPPMLPLLFLLVQGVVALDCPGGEYWYSKQSDNYCVACPQGYSNNATDATRFCNACPKGFWSSTSRTLACTGCAEGKYGVQLGSTSSSGCVDCPLDFHSDVGAEDCYYHCRPGSYLTSTDTGPGSRIQSYSKGVYEKNGEQIALTMLHGSTEAECTDVPRGEYMDEYGVIMQDQGDYFNVSTPDGYGNVFTFGAKPCLPGTYSDDLGATVCKICPVGYRQHYPNAPFCNQCANGRYNDIEGLTDTQCTICPSGYVTEYNPELNQYVNHDKCINEVCQLGYYKPVSVCVECPQGYYQDILSANISSCKTCPIGRYGPYPYAPSIEHCHDCSRGRYQPDVGESSCLACQSGTYSDTRGSSSCKTCPTGKTSVDGSQRLGHCLNCEGGYIDERYIGNNWQSTSCFTCPVGYKSTGDTCTQCPIGTFSDTPGALECSDCTVGMYGDEEGVSECKRCDDTWSNCLHDVVLCEPGKYANTRHGSGIYSTELGSTCEFCPYGKWNNLEGQASCIDCPSGTSISGVGMLYSTLCTVCWLGQYSDTPSGKCEDCPPGKWSISTGMATCNDCSDGTGWSPTPAGASSGLLLLGPSVSVPESTCEECTPGKYAAGGMECTDCPEGYYQDEAAASGCKGCGPGRQVHPNYPNGGQPCIDCGPGQYSTADTTCTDCPAGKWNDEPLSSACKDCPHYSTTVGATSSGSCLLCPKGTIPYDSTQFDCGFCEAGKVTFIDDNDVTSCNDCPPGEIQSNGGAYNFLFSNDYKRWIWECSQCNSGQVPSAGDTECIDCEAGRYSNVDNCNICPAGYYNGPEATGNWFCQGCAPSKYNPNEGSLDETVCQLCPFGFWGRNVPNAGSPDCLTCAPGEYPECAAKGYPECIKYHNSDGVFEGATSSDTCLDCPFGYAQDPYNEFGCMRCEKGKFVKGVANIACRTCPTGYYDFMTGNPEWVQPYYHTEQEEILVDPKRVYSPGTVDMVSSSTPNPGYEIGVLDTTNVWVHNIWRYPAVHYYQITLRMKLLVYGAITQGGGSDVDSWWTTVAFQYSDTDETTWVDVDGGHIFTANTDRNTKVEQTFATPVTAKYIRFICKSFSSTWRAGRFGLTIADSYTIMGEPLPLYTTSEFCQHCPAGFYRLERTDNTPYSYGLDSVCTACPEGFYSAMKSGQCAQCAVL